VHSLRLPLPSDIADSSRRGRLARGATSASTRCRLAVPSSRPLAEAAAAAAAVPLGRCLGAAQVSLTNHEHIDRQ